MRVRRTLPSPIAAVLFDFAGTLFDARSLRDVHLQQLRYVATAAGLDAPDDQLRAAYRHGMAVAFRTVAVQPMYLHRTLFAAAFEAMAELLGGRIDHTTAQAAVDRQRQVTIDSARLRPESLSTLGTLRAAGLHVQIVSNIDDDQLVPMIERLGLGHVVDAVTSSESAGSCKPDPGIFELALGKAGAEPDHALFVGDNIGHDIVGPAAVGIHTAWLALRPDADPGDARPDAIIDTLSDVLALVGLPAADRRTVPR